MSDEGARIRARREFLGLEKTELAALAKIHRNTLSALEAGDGASVRTLAKVRRALAAQEELHGVDAPGEHPPDLPSNLPPGEIVVIRLAGPTGGEVVVEGPIGDRAELEAVALRLFDAMQERADD